MAGDDIENMTRDELLALLRAVIPLLDAIVMKRRQAMLLEMGPLDDYVLMRNLTRTPAVPPREMRRQWARAWEQVADGG